MEKGERETQTNYYYSTSTKYGLGSRELDQRYKECQQMSLNPPTQPVKHSVKSSEYHYNGFLYSLYFCLLLFL